MSLMTDISDFETSKSLAKRALSSTKSNKIKLLTEYRERLNQSFKKMNNQWQLYQNDTVEKDELTLEEFNEIDEGTQKPRYELNSEWSEKQLEVFGDLVDDIDEALEGNEVKPSVAEEPSEEEHEKLCNKAKAEITNVETGVTSLVRETDGVEEFSENIGVVTHL